MKNPAQGEAVPPQFLSRPVRLPGAFPRLRAPGARKRGSALSSYKSLVSKRGKAPLRRLRLFRDYARSRHGHRGRATWGRNDPCHQPLHSPWDGVPGQEGQEGQERPLSSKVPCGSANDTQGIVASAGQPASTSASTPAGKARRRQLGFSRLVWPRSLVLQPPALQVCPEPATSAGNRTKKGAGLLPRPLTKARPYLTKLGPPHDRAANRSRIGQSDLFGGCRRTDRARLNGAREAAAGLARPVNSPADRPPRTSPTLTSCSPFSRLPMFPLDGGAPCVL
jgi:hypothetical protein